MEAWGRWVEWSRLGWKVSLASAEVLTSLGCSGDREPNLPPPSPLSSASWVLRWVGEPPLRCLCLTGVHLVQRLLLAVPRLSLLSFSGYSSGQAKGSKSQKDFLFGDRVLSGRPSAWGLFATEGVALPWTWTPGLCPLRPLRSSPGPACSTCASVVLYCSC